MKTFIIIFILLISSSVLASPQVKILLHVVDHEVVKSGTECGSTKKVVKSVQKTSNIYFLTISELLKEMKSPLQKDFQKIVVKSGTAQLYFAEKAMDLLNGSMCVQEGIKTPIEKTLRSFRDIKTVENYIDGKLVTEWDA